jgi:hypothetical protein
MAFNIQCRYDECRYAMTLCSVFTLDTFMLHVAMLSVVAPFSSLGPKLAFKIKTETLN